MHKIPFKLHRKKISKANMKYLINTIFKPEDFKNNYHRIFFVENMLFNFVDNGTEIILFVSEKERIDEFFLMTETSLSDKIHIVKKNEQEFDFCKRMIRNEDIRKEALLYRKSKNRMIRGICKFILDRRKSECFQPLNTLKLTNHISLNI